MKRILLFGFVLFYKIASAQISASQQTSLLNFIAAKEFSKDIALYRAKEFAMKEILGISPNVVQFEIDPLAASNSGELTSLAYLCPSKSKEGLVLGFFGEYWNNAGVHYQGYAFKDLPKAKAVELLNKIDNTILSNSEYLGQDCDNNNLYFQFDDMTLLIYCREGGSGGYSKIRIFWNGFDAEWDNGAYKRTVKRFNKKLK